MPSSPRARTPASGWLPSSSSRAPATGRSALFVPRRRRPRSSEPRKKRASTSRPCCSTSPMQMRVTAVLDDIGADLYGLVNNAGYGITGAIEDVTDDEARHLHRDDGDRADAPRARLALPGMRTSRSRPHRQRVVDHGARDDAAQGWYQGAKHALEAVSDALACRGRSRRHPRRARRARRVPHEHLGGHGARHRQRGDSRFGSAYRRTQQGMKLSSPLMGEPGQCARSSRPRSRRAIPGRATSSGSTRGARCDGPVHADRPEGPRHTHRTRSVTCAVLLIATGGTIAASRSPMAASPSRSTDESCSTRSTGSTPTTSTSSTCSRDRVGTSTSTR